MARLVGYLGDVARAAPDILRQVGQRGRTEAAGERLAYGIGYHQQAEILRRRHPRVVEDAVDVSQAAEGLHSHALICRVYRGEHAPQRIDDIQPFTYGAWTFALLGTLPEGGGLLERVRADLPDSMRRGIRGHSAPEVFFNLFLARLVDAGISPRSWNVDPPRVASALLNTVSQWELVTRAGQAPGDDRIASIGVLLTNGRSLLALARGVRLQCLPLRWAQGEASAATLDESGRLDGPGALLFFEEPEPRPDEIGLISIEHALVWVGADLRLHRQP